MNFKINQGNWVAASLRHLTAAPAKSVSQYMQMWGCIQAIWKRVCLWARLSYAHAMSPIPNGYLLKEVQQQLMNSSYNPDPNTHSKW